MKLSPLVSTLIAASSLALASDWPQWRGPTLDGRSPEKNLPVKWSATENISWKLPLPSLSGSTPIISGNRLFLSLADGDHLALWCLDKTNGKVIWKQPVEGANRPVRKGDMTSPSPVTDGKTVYILNGAGTLKAFDFDGKALWHRNFQDEYGKWGLNHGYGSSPMLWEDAIFVQVLHGMHTTDPSYVVRVDKKTGKNVWRVERPTEAVHESPDSYSTPAMMKVDGHNELIVTGGDAITGHDPATGKELWRGTGFNLGKDPAYRIIASPLVFRDIVFAPTRVKPLIAFRGGGKGDVTSSHRLWSFQNGPDVPTPVTDGEYFYTINDRGIAWCLKVATGEEVYGGQRIAKGTYSTSMVMADGKLYITNEDGLTTVLKAGPKFEVIAENDIPEYTLSSIAVSDGRLYLRTRNALYAIGK